MQRLLLLACLLLAAPNCGLAQSRASAQFDSGESRTALIIGNASYKDSPLANPINDARAVAKALGDSGFQVKLHVNLTQAQMRRVIREFGDELHAKQGVGLFYFAGHGVQISNRNFLIPVGADIQREYEVEDQAVDASAVLAMMESAKARVNIVVLDACRNNPFMRNFRSAINGLAPMQAPAGTLVAFSTAPGQTAIDGTGQYGLYTEHLVSNLAVPGLKIEDVFKNVRVEVQRVSSGKQVPWENTSLTGDFYFKPPVATVAQSTGATAADVDRAVQGALRRRDEEEAARRTAQQSEIERAVLAALRRREEEQAAAQLARAEKENQEAKIAIERLNRELAELRAARETSPQPTAAPPPPVPAAAPQVARVPQPSATTPPQVARAPQPSAAPPTQLALATPSAPRAAPTATVGGRVERPDVRVGDRWKYQITEGFSGRKHAAIVEVASVTESLIYTQTARTTLVATGVATAAGTVDVWDRDWNQLRSGEQEYTPNYPWLQFPLESGKTWSARARHTASGIIPTTFQLAAKVEGWERVTVPAGTFDAVKITWTGNFTGEKEFDSTVGISSGNVTNVIWYAPAVRQAVKKEIRMQDFNIRASQSLQERWELMEYQVDGVESSPPAAAPTQLALATPSAPRATPVVAVGGRVERPDVRAGDRWKYQVTEGFSGRKHAAIVEVASVTDNMIYTQTARTTLVATGVAAAAGTVDVWDRDWNQLRSGEQEYAPFYPWLQFPLESGKTWSARARHTASGIIPTTFQLAAKVEGWEKVTVPAGTFDAVKITWTGTFTGEKEFDSTVGISSGSVTNVIWYAPAVRQAVKKEIRMQDFNIRASQSITERWELMEYQVDGAESPSSPAAAPQLALATPSAPRAAPTATVGGRVERPDVRVGDRWKYQVTEGFSGRKHAAIVEVASVTESLIYTQTARTTLVATGVAASAGTVDVWDRHWNQLRHGEQEYAPFYPWLQFPLESGKTWSARARHTAPNTIATSFQLAAKVEGWEKVTVPAGTFDAVKITWTGNFTGEKEFDSTVGISSGNVTNVIWYAPAVRQAVKKEIRMQDFNIRASQSVSERWELMEYKAD